ncbi:hypothetical protein [Cupriavidus necator]|uniref:hypothetical protein n=1 Tax=Cupriavidus necator TaxID=106590 RepID=UPI00068C6C67|nr:hypothetical protein [Cupriavidus necator]
MSEQNKAASTPAATWRVNGEDDPHGDYYDRERAALTLGNLTDDELANGAFMNYDHRPSLDDLLAGKAFMPIVWMTAVKDRIRWLSRALFKAQAASAALAQQPQGEAPQKLFGFDVVVDGSMPPGTMEFRAAAPAVPVAQGLDVDAVMTKIQEFASTWAVVGGRFDDGSAMERAEECKAEIRAILSRASSSRAEVEKSSERYQFLRRCRGMEHDPPFTVQHELDGTLWGGDLDAAIDDYRAMLAAAEATNDQRASKEVK